MARYIDADALKERLVDFSKWCKDGRKQGVDFVLDCPLPNTPTADVVPKSEEGAECPTCHGTGRIGTTNWFTEHLSKEQLAKEKAKAIAEHELHIKQDYAREIFKDIDDWLACDLIPYLTARKSTLSSTFAKLKKKYTEEGGAK